ncbi:DUF4190 domain-containing protein [Pseudoxanthomonas sp. SGNA-20]|jgi:hypothetical protein|uniref:Uncharacterized protein DUF4190 n=1 Tax=Pseudoxanthomonas taiwanensis J19 TaxID=935569 RepID=A0A562E7D2_9GAMM|nr:MULTISPECIES: DUF4190 domain-containing protein [Pseudoxanthomonas]RRN55037.1 DUF4190 domain-containing protein [Pseudoxanthomonas sp. SGNA-20]RRN80325.1 DUF4190 domain-containing protein [Pseudoxanthomonas sp. SGD-10]TWH17707.1 uncharacterized protein DUF4190 [Pseudoxanthomonas taiwanensis J19]
MNQIPKTSPLAVTSLVTGLLGWTLLPLLGSLVAIVTGHMARSEIRRSGGTLDGDGMALVGLALGWAPVVLGLLGLMVVFLFLGGVAWLASVG